MGAGGNQQVAGYIHFEIAENAFDQISPAPVSLRVFHAANDRHVASSDFGFVDGGVGRVLIGQARQRRDGRRTEADQSNGVVVRVALEVAAQTALTLCREQRIARRREMVKADGQVTSRFQSVGCSLGLTKALLT